MNNSQSTMSAGVPRARRRPARKKKTKPLRLFLGLGFPLYEHLSALRDDLEVLASAESSLRIAPAQNLHITLKFLGAVEPGRIKEIHALCASVCSRFDAMELTSQGLGVFKNSLWVGIAEQQALQMLASELNAAGRLLGVSDESRTFLPHVTVARFGKKADLPLSSLLEKYEATEWGRFTAQKCYLYQSETFQEGARYSVLQGYSLGTDTSEGEESEATD
jgi:2'-5' RNA ligase